jgi:hypothetical protein
MKVEINLAACKRNKITPDQYVLLYLLHFKDFKTIEAIFTKSYAIILRNQLNSTKYILGKPEDKFRETVLSKNNVCKLLGIRTDEIAFVDFYLEYPIRVKNRVLRAGSVDTVLGKKHEEKYLKRVTTKKAHEEAIKAVKAFVATQKQAGRLEYLPNMETVLNNSMWEQWDQFIQVEGQEEMVWNEESI